MNVDQLYKSVFPILEHEESGKVSVAGTSVLIEYQGLPFLVTAAHVLRINGNNNPIYLSLEGENIKLDGPASMSKDIDVELDLALFDLRRHTTLRESLIGYQTISLDDPVELPLFARSHFFIFGFPWRKAYHDKKESSIKIKPLTYTTDKASEDSYRKYSRSINEHLIVSYKQKNTINQNKSKTIAPKPHGTSGGPIFKYLVDEYDNSLMLIFEGILIEWKGNEVIVATRKSALISFISHVM